MRTYNFKVVLEPDEDFDGNPSGWHAFCPALETQGASTWGETREQALKNIDEVVRMIVEELIEEGKSLQGTFPDNGDAAQTSQEQLHVLVTV
jgi:predicted RNase H-like HicB family nuclease